MMKADTMISQSTLDFLKALKKNNNREWFEKNRGKYKLAKNDFEAFTGKMLGILKVINPKLASLEVKDCVFRIYRDVRFSKNKQPYKTNMGAYFVEGGKKSEKAGFYIQIEPGNCFIGGGCWMPQVTVLKAVRQEIDYNLKEFNSILSSRAFKTHFGSMTDYKLKTTPRGYDAGHPGIEHLRQTSFVVGTVFRDKDFTSKNITRKCGDTYKAMKPFLDFLNEAI